MADRAFALASQRALAWAFDDAGPLWLERGRNPRTGVFLERLSLADAAPTEHATRTIVQARQIYSFATLGRLGWPGAWSDAVDAGLRHLRKLHAEAGYYVYASTPDGAAIDTGPDLYTQAFVMFALAHVSTIAPEQAKRCEREALDVLGFLERSGRAVRGFRLFDTPDRLASNPHMHLFETALAWCEISDRREWRALRDDIGALALERFIQDDGTLREHFNADWSTAEGDEGRIAEPGHQFEWAWLLARFGRSPASPAWQRARELTAWGEKYGIDRRRRVAYQALDCDGAIVDGSARLWPQTERLKAHLILREREEGIARILHGAAALESVNAIFAYFDTPVRGLWRDRMLTSGDFLPESAPASSFYHIMCAFDELARAATVADRPADVSLAS